MIKQINLRKRCLKNASLHGAASLRVLLLFWLWVLVTGQA